MPYRKFSPDNPLLPMDRLGEALVQARLHREMMAVMSFDLDDFEQITERIGQAGAEKLLDELGRRASSALRDRDAVIRLGEDQFLIMATRIGSIAQTEAVSKRVLAKVGEPIELEGQWISPSISLGVAVYPDHARSAEALVMRCFSARFEASALGKGRYVLAPTLA